MVELMKAATRLHTVKKSTALRVQRQFQRTAALVGVFALAVVATGASQAVTNKAFAGYIAAAGSMVCNVSQGTLLYLVTEALLGQSDHSKRRLNQVSPSSST